MQPRVDIVAVSEDSSAEEIFQTAISTRYSRLPVYRGAIDNIIGVVLLKDLLSALNSPIIERPRASVGEGTFAV